jgi:hypothetical protein
VLIGFEQNFLPKFSGYNNCGSYRDFESVEKVTIKVTCKKGRGPGTFAHIAKDKKN